MNCILPDYEAREQAERFPNYELLEKSYNLFGGRRISRSRFEQVKRQQTKFRKARLPPPTPGRELEIELPAA